MDYTYSAGSNWLFFGMVALFGGYMFYNWWQRRNSRITRGFLIGMNTVGVPLEVIANGEIDGLPYTLYVGGKSPIMEIQLQFESRAHIMALGHLDSDVEATVRGLIHFNKSVEQVDLEGDFPNYFRLYTEDSMHVELRQVLDPATMAFLVDFSEENDWEIIGKRLVMVNRGMAQATTNDTPMTGDATEFARRIMPTLRRMAK